MKPKEELPKTYQHMNDLGFTETSTAFPVLPEPPLYTRAIETIRIGWGKLVAFLGVLIAIIWAIATHPDELQKSWEKISQFINRNSDSPTTKDKNNKQNNFTSP